MDYHEKNQKTLIKLLVLAIIALSAIVCVGAFIMTLDTKSNIYTLESLTKSEATYQSQPRQFYAKSEIAEDGQHIDKHICPEGLQPELELSVKGILEVVSVDELNNAKAWYETKSDYFVVHLDYQAIAGPAHAGELNVFHVCNVV